MSMNLIEANLAQRASLPLPSAALIIDMRGTNEDDINIMDSLRIEVTDLVDEMRVHGLRHWRYLTDFLSFRTLPLLQKRDLESIRSQENPQAKPISSTGQRSPKDQSTLGLTGLVGTANDDGSPFQDNQGGLIGGGKPFDIFQQYIEEMILEIDRLRNNRIAAQTDLNKAGITGHTTRDATVRIIFLTSAESNESLSSASAYAAHLKAHFRKLEREGYQALISTTMICLDSSSEGGPPEGLIKGLRWNDRWDHLDSLILSEKYSDNSALIAGAMQTYLAELLLYTLLIIPPLRVNASITPLTPDVPLLDTQTGQQQTQGEWVTLPINTYLVGLTAVEHSARWGRRWLNYGLVIHAVDILQNKVAEDEPEHRRIKNIVAAWLSDWRAHVIEAIPDRIPGNIQALNALPQALDTAHSASQAFQAKQFSFSIGKMTIKDLQAYLEKVKSTYIIPPSERPAVRKAAQTIAESTDIQLAVTLQDAMDSIPLIQQRLREWEVKDPALKKGTPLVNAQLEAQTVLSHPGFYSGATGSVPRARLELQELAIAISDFENAHQQTTLNLMQKRADVDKQGKDRIEALKQHVDHIPLLAKFLRLAMPMFWLTVLLAFCLIFLAVLLGLSWLAHLVFLNAPNSAFLPIINDALNLNAAPPLGYFVWAAIIALILAAVFSLSRSVLKPLSALKIELLFWLGLVVFAGVGIPFSLSISQFAGDPVSLSLLTWLAPLPAWSEIAFVLVVVIAASELIWLWVWYSHLLNEREQIVRELGFRLEQDVEEVRRFIADSVALQLLRRAGLTDGMGGPGPYYQRVNQLYNQLKKVSTIAGHQKEMAARRLSLSLSETQPGMRGTNGPWLNLKIREEWLDGAALAEGYKRLTNYLGREADELKEFSEMLLRMMGEEAPIEIEQQFREKSFTGGREQRQAHILMTTLATMILRFLVSAQPVDAMTPIIDRYENLDNQYIHQLPALNALIQTLRRRVSEVTLQPLYDAGNGVNGNNLAPRTDTENIILATDGFATWGQLLWEHKDDKLDAALVQDGVLPKLLGDGYDPRAVMRRLYVRTSLFGRPIQAGQPGEAYLLLAPSTQSRMFRQSLNIPSRLIIDFPDTERLLLLYIQQYIAEPLFVPVGQNGDATV